MKIAFNPSTVAALTAPPNNKDITFDLRGRSIFARGVKFYGTDTNTWRDIKINNVSIGSNILDLRNGSNTTLTNTNGVVTINSTWRPVVDNLTSNSTTSSLSANQGRILKALIDGKSNSDHNHDGRYVKRSGDTMLGALNFANGTWNLVGDASYIGDCNVDGHFGIKAANTTYPGIAFFNNSSTFLGNLTAYSGNIKYGAYSLQFLDNGNTSVSASTQTNPFNAYNSNAVADGQAVCVWGQGSYLGNLVNDTGDMSLWLKRVNAKVATLNMVLDGEYYANGNQRLAHVSEIPTSLKNPHALTISLNGTSQGPYDGSAAKNINITPSSIGAAVSNHSHDYLVVNAADDKSFNSAYHNFQVLYAGEGNGITGKPANVDAFGLFKFRTASGWSGQMLLANTGSLYIRSSEDANMTSTLAWRTILDSSNYSGILDSRYYTESEVNSLLSKKLNTSDFNWTNLPGKLVAGNEFNIVNSGFNAELRFNYLPINNRNSTATVRSYYFGNGAKGQALVQASGFIKAGSSSSYVLLGDGGHKAVSDFASSSHSHNYAANENYGGFTKLGRLPISGFYQSDEYASGGNAPFSGQMHLINCQYNNTGNNYALQIAASLYDNNMFKIRVTNDNVRNAWRDIIHSGNIGSQTVANAYHLRINSADTWSTWYWSGQSGQPSWLWGSDDGTNMYVYNPSNFRVSYANSAGNADTVDGEHASNLVRAGYYDSADLNSLDTYSFIRSVYSDNSSTSPKGSTGWYNVIQLVHRNGVGAGPGYIGQIALGMITNTNDMFFRGKRTDPWKTVIHSGNYTEFINNYYWANVKISASPSTTTSPTVHTLTATRVCAGHDAGLDNSISCSNWFRSSGDTGWYNSTYQGGWYMSDRSWIRAHNGVGIYTSGQLYSSSSIRMGNIFLEHTDEINNSTNGGIHLNFRNSGNVSLCAGGGRVGVGTTTPSYKLDVNGQMRADGFNHLSVNSNNYMLLAGGGYKSLGGDDSTPIFLGSLNLYHGDDGTVSNTFYCLGYSVPFTYTRGGHYCKIVIPDTTRLSFYISAAIASVNYSGGGMDTWVDHHRGNGAWWLHCYAAGRNEVRVKGFRLGNTNNDSWWGGNPLWSNNDGANIITVCIFGYAKYN